VLGPACNGQARIPLKVRPGFHRLTLSAEDPATVWPDPNDHRDLLLLLGNPRLEVRHELQTLADQGR